MGKSAEMTLNVHKTSSFAHEKPQNAQKTGAKCTPAVAETPIFIGSLSHESRLSHSLWDREVIEPQWVTFEKGLVPRDFKKFPDRVIDFPVVDLQRSNRPRSRAGNQSDTGHLEREA
jgi:hypothetical protein